MKEFVPIIILVIILVIIIISWYFSKKSKFKRIFKKAPLKKIDKIKNGEVAKLIGDVVITEETLIAPLSARSCVSYYLLIEERVQSGKNHHWKKMIEEEVFTNFIVDDGSSLAYINSKNLKSYTVLDKKYKSGTFNDASPELESFLRQRGRESEGPLGFNRTIRYREGIIEKGEKIAVLGKCKWRDSSEFDLKLGIEQVLTFDSSLNEPVYLSDEPDFTNIEYPKFNRKNYRKIT